MYVLIVRRVVKHNTGATQKFAPRSANREELRACGPFRTLRAAERAAVTVLGTHTCLDAQIWSREQIEATNTKGWAANGELLHAAITAAMRLLAVQ